MDDNKPSARQLLNFETVGAIVAMLVGACALFVSWDQAQVMRKQQHASVWPLVNSEFLIDPAANGLSLELVVTNRGVGPALIESAFLTVNGVAAQDRVSLLRSIFGDETPSGSARVVGASIESAALGAGETTQVFEVSWETTDANIAAFTALARRYIDDDGPDVAVNICYCSVFDRCFTSTGEGRPQRTKSCPAATGLFSNMFRDNQASVQ